MKTVVQNVDFAERGCAWRTSAWIIASRASHMAGTIFIAITVFFGALTDGKAASSRLPQFLAKLVPSDIVPGADRFGQVEGEASIVDVYKGDSLVGYTYLNSDFVNATGYSGKPIHLVVGLDPEGTIVGAKLVDHHEPIVLIGIPERKVVDFIAGYLGFNPVKAAALGERAPNVDIVSGATVTVLVIGDSLTRSAARVARIKGLGGAEPEIAGPSGAVRVVDLEAGEAADWERLLGEGAIRRLHLSIGEVSDAFSRSGHAKAAARPEPGAPEDSFIDLYVALVSQPAIGRSLLGETEYAALASRLKPGQHAILVAGSGAYSFKGSGYVRGGIFDRIEVVQGTETVRFRDRLHRRIASLSAEGAPEFREIGIFTMPDKVEFNPADPWRLQLLAQRATGALDKAFITFDLAYNLPERYVRIEETKPAEATPSPAEQRHAEAAGGAGRAAGSSLDPSGEQPLWERIWWSKTTSIGIVLAMILTLTSIFFFQDFLVKRPVLFDRIRLAFLTVTLFWLGWIAQAQLSVVNVLTFASALRSDFQWSSFLMDPLVFILWFAVAAALLFWGRGPFCGWLCPFGALQELANRVAKKLGVPQVKVRWGLHERLWPIKYIIFLVIFGVSLGSLALAETLAEVEPFKTAIILRFMRDWWFVAFALALVGAGLFIERFFCRYLCPLGAALAIPGRLRMFDWLKRYKECGNPCMRCSNECPVQAIHPEGNINPNECISCLHCQVLYHHDQKCPVMIQRRIKREKRAALSSSSMQPGGPGLSKTRTVQDGAGQPAERAPAAPDR